MAVKKFSPITPSRRYLTVSDFADISSNRNNPQKGLIAKKGRSGGRNHYGRVTNINKGGGHKQRYRIIDFKLDKVGIPAKVVAIEYDPNRSGRIALVQYADGEKRYILAPNGLEVGRELMVGPEADIKPGNALPLKNIPTGQEIYNIALQNGGAAALVRSAGAYAQLVAKEGDYVTVRLPSGEVRKVLASCYAVIGAVSNAEHKNIVLGKAGRSRWLGRRPHNRGVTKNPVDHPMGGGEGKSAGGRHPCSPTGVIAKGKKTRMNKRTQKFIVRPRGKGKGAV